MFSTPQSHAANPPDTWLIVKRRPGSWATTTKDGGVLEYHETKKAAVESLTTGPMAALYEKERRWYAGDTPPGWVPYDPVKHDRPITSPKGA